MTKGFSRGLDAGFRVHGVSGPIGASAFGQSGCPDRISSNQRQARRSLDSSLQVNGSIQLSIFVKAFSFFFIRPRFGILRALPGVETKHDADAWREPSITGKNQGHAQLETT